MALRLILGSSGSGKSRLLFDTVLKRAQEHPEGRFIVLVPEQFTMQTQRDLVELSSCGGILNIDVLSFTRLAYRVFEQTGVERRAVLSETGKSLLLRLIAAREGSELALLSGILDRPGVIGEMKSILSELDQYGITPDTLSKLQAELAASPGSQRLSRKLEEIRLLQEAFERYQSDHFITGEKLPRVLCAKAPLDPTLKGAELYLDGYTGFTPAQLDVIETLLPIAADITVTVTIDPQVKELRAEDPIRAFETGTYRGYELFALSRRTIASLIEAARRCGVSIESPWVLDGSVGRLKRGSELDWLERHLFRQGRAGREPYAAPGADGQNTYAAPGADCQNTYAAPGTDGQSPNGAPCPEDQDLQRQQILLRSCADPWDEAVSAAVTVRELLGRGMRYRDIAIVCGSMKEYSEYIRRAFDTYEIPYFIDQSSPVILNPAFEYVESCIDVLEKNYSYESVMRLIRTGLVPGASKEEADLLENYLLAAGIRGRKAWSSPFTRKTRKQDETLRLAAERARGAFMEKFLPFAEVMKRGKAPLRERAAALWQFILDCDIPAKMEELGEACAQEGRQDRAAEYGQVVRVIADVLDEAAELIGDEPVTRRQFMDILKAGFSEAKIGIIPPGIDEVHVGDLQRTRLEHIRAVLFLGLNDGFVPPRRTRGGVLNDMERETLKERHVRLAPTAREDANIQQFYLYLTLTKPSDLLVLSWSEADRKGGEMRCASVVTSIRKLFPARGLLSAASQKPYYAVTSQRTGLPVLAGALSDWLWSDQETALRREAELRELLRIYREPGGAWQQEALALLAKAGSSAMSADIDPETAARLYGSVLRGSISRLEEYALCPFRQFASYGLELREREEYTIESSDTGNLLHASMEIFSRRMKENPEGYTWDTIPDEVRDEWARDALAQALGTQNAELYRDSARGMDTMERCRGVVERTVRTIQAQVRRGLFVPARFEVEFNSADEMTGIGHLPGGAQLQLRGRIDRIDECEDEKSNTVYVKVIDYKSSETTTDLERFITGEQLQLIVYMDAAARLEQRSDSSRTVVCAGLFYYEMQDPILKSDSAGEDPESAMLRETRVRGLLNADPEVLQRLDRTLTPGSSSLVIPARLNNDGSLRSNSNALTTQQIDELRAYSRVRMRQIASSILEGEIRPVPSRGSGSTACDYCSYGDVCHFNARERGMAYNERIKRDDAQRWSAIRDAIHPQEEGADRTGGTQNG